MLKQLLLFPFGGNAREALIMISDINSMKMEWDVLGFIDDEPSTWGKELLGVKVLGGREVFKKYPDVRILAVPGYADNYLKRKNIISSLQIEKNRFATIIHPSVIASPDARIGHNTILMANIVVSCGTSVGNHCVILPNTVISHDSHVGDYCCIGSNVSVSGSVNIEQNCYVGSGTRILENITIGEKSLVGLGSNVLTNVEQKVVVAGNPAKTIRKIEG